jgi:purine-binding chemotaxis protein CheW
MTEAQQLVVFSLSGEEYALPITRIQEIIRYTKPRSIASHTPWIRGVINLRGKIVPICDLAMRLGIHHDHPDTAKIAVVDSSTGTAGIIVDSVEEVLTITADQIETIDTADSDYIDGVAKLGERLPVLLNADRLLEEINQAA